ncbi:hypothetical protein MLD38_003027 [Melastoma candidum]|uniref:Uncharacterized protein n=1 Tax=Melastoma candidum TaxID=119954 RepID=A0ACB9S0W9_9MYRT|nr:hypothetical protein MLD38_003027 [Melastoma candidum]
MDVLFNTINVRDLLPSSDADDPNSPLSAPDLRLLIQKLDSHSRTVRSQVQSYLVSHHEEFSSLFSLCSDVVSRTDDVSADLDRVASLLSADRPIDVEIREVVEEIERKTREVRLRRELLELARIICGISERFKGVRESVRVGRLRVAAEEIRDLKVAVRVSDKEEEGGRPLVYDLLRKDWFDCFEELQGLLSSFVERAVRYDKESRMVVVKHHELSVDGIEGIDFHLILESLDVVGLLDYGLARVADLMIKYVITPVINSASPITFVEELKQDGGNVVEAVLKLEQCSRQEIRCADDKQIFLDIVNVIKFICQYVCFNNVSWIQSFGRLSWSRMSELIITNVLTKAVPEDSSELANFQKIIEITSEFETALRELNFISASNNEDYSLSDFAEKIEVHFASRKKGEILRKARMQLLDCDFTIPLKYSRRGPSAENGTFGEDASGRVVDLLFLSEKCLVSTAASELMKLVHQTLKDVCSSSNRLVLDMYHAVRDAILLYEAIIPIKQEKQLDGINQVAVLMHNDYLYIAQEVLALAFLYRPEFPDPIKERIVFVDLAPRLHLKAEQVLQRQIQLVIHNLDDAMDGANGFQNTHQLQQFESARLSIDQVAFILEKVHIIWEPLLHPSIYLKSMSTVLESVFSRIAREILFIDDMAAEETLQLQRLIYLLLENMTTLFDSLNSINQEGKSPEHSSYWLTDSMRSLSKLRKLAEILDMPLRSITAEWESGDLGRCGFTLSEVKDFIKAIFADSPLRKECLWRIENGRF